MIEPEFHTRTIDEIRTMLFPRDEIRIQIGEHGKMRYLFPEGGSAPCKLPAEMRKEVESWPVIDRDFFGMIVVRNPHKRKRRPMTQPTEKKLLTIKEIVRMFPHMDSWRQNICEAACRGVLNRVKIADRKYKYILDDQLREFCLRYEKKEKKKPVPRVSKKRVIPQVAAEKPAVKEELTVGVPPEEAPKAEAAKPTNGQAVKTSEETERRDEILMHIKNIKMESTPEDIIQRPRRQLNNAIVMLALARLRGAAGEELESVERAYEQTSTGCRAFSRSLRMAARELDRDRRRHRWAILVRKLFGV